MSPLSSPVVSNLLMSIGTIFAEVDQIAVAMCDNVSLLHAVRVYCSLAYLSCIKIMRTFVKLIMGAAELI